MAGNIAAIAHPLGGVAGRGIVGAIGLGLAVGGAVGIGLQGQRRHDEDATRDATGKQMPGYSMPGNTHERQSQQLWLTGGGTAMAVAGGIAAAFGHGALRGGGFAALGAAALMYGGAALLEPTMDNARRDDQNDLRLQSYEKGDATPGSPTSTTPTAKPTTPATTTPTVTDLGHRLFTSVDVNSDNTFDQTDADLGDSAVRAMYVVAGAQPINEKGLTDKLVRPYDSNGDDHIDPVESSDLVSGLSDKLMSAEVSMENGSTGGTATSSGGAATTQSGGAPPATAPPGGWADGQPTATTTPQQPTGYGYAYPASSDTGTPVTGGGASSNSAALPY